jgi:hypothetical protein
MITINEVFSYLGNISSIAGIILTVYTILRSIEKSHEITKKEIVRTLLIQLRDFNKISNLEIKSIIKSKCRENNLSIRNISPKQVIDDLFFEVISSPLLNKEKKDYYFEMLKVLSFENFLSYTKSLNKENITIHNFQNIDDDVIKKELEDFRLKKYYESDNAASSLFLKRSSIISTFLVIFVISLRAILNINMINIIDSYNGFSWALILILSISLTGIIFALLPLIQKKFKIRPEGI